MLTLIQHRIITVLSMFEQLSLFPLESNDRKSCFHTNIQESGFDYQELDIGDITFKAGQLEPVHRWYRLTPSYSPGLVRFLIKEFEIYPDHFVLDPFSGRGTTSIECQKHGINNLGIEINPILQQVGSKSLKCLRSSNFIKKSISKKWLLYLTPEFRLFTMYLDGGKNRC